MLASLSAGILLGLSAGFSPGPLLALVISHTLRHGAREGMKVAMAPLLTDLPIILLSLLLLARIAGVRPLLGAVSLAGALLLLFIARDTFTGAGIDIPTTPCEPRSLWKGALVNILSPHPWLFWITVGGPLVMQGWLVSPTAAVAFIAGFLACLIGAKIVVALLAERSRGALTGKAYKWSMRLIALLLLTYVFLLARTGLDLLGFTTF